MANKRPHYVSPARIESARDALERALMAQQNSSEESPTELPEGEEEFATNTEFTQRVEENRAVKRAIEEQEKLNTRVSIDDAVAFERKALPPAPPKTENKRTAIIGKKDDIVAQRTYQWTNYLVNDANPLLVKVTANFVGIPNETWLDGVVMEAIDPKTNKRMVFWDPALRTRLELSEDKARKLAKAAAEFSVSPMGVGIFTWIETHQFMIAMGAALMVGAQYGWTLMQTKAEVTQLSAIYKEQMAAQMAQMQKPPTNFQQPVVDTEQRLPGFNESVVEYDGKNS